MPEPPGMTPEQLARGLAFLRSREQPILTDEELVAFWFRIFNPTKDEHHVANRET